MNKYRNKKIKTAEGVFDSKKELRRWEELKLMLAEGKIKNLQRQVEFELIPKQLNALGKVIERKCCYKADFVYEYMGDKIVEDVKGFKGGAGYGVFVIKRKLMLYVHNLKVVEI